MKCERNPSDVCYLPFLGLFLNGLVVGTEGLLAECHVKN